MFKQMLAEKEVSVLPDCRCGLMADSRGQVSAFSTWEKELHKIVFDPRYLLLTSKERKVVFDDYVRDRAEKERQEKRALFRKARDDFRALVEEAKATPRTSFNEFCLHYSKDERFKRIEKMREREALFTECVNEIRRRDRDKMVALRDQVSLYRRELFMSPYKAPLTRRRGRTSISC